jgi:hypothetical protein
MIFGRIESGSRMMVYRVSRHVRTASILAAAWYLTDVIARLEGVEGTRAA